MKSFLQQVGRTIKRKVGQLGFTRVLIASALAVAMVPVATAYLAPPSGFQTNLVVGSGLNGPSGFEIAPDGRIFVLERTGAVKIVENGELLPEPFVTFDSVATGDRGLIGIAFDPDFGISNHWVYFYYTGTDLLNHVVRYDASTNTAQNGPFTIFETQSPSHELHVGGTIQFGPDGKMYFAVGDNGYPPNGQDLTNPHGKILRINKDGTIPTDNPFYGEPDKLGAIWAYGMRNPWRFQFDSQTGELYSSDVGDYTWEEVNRIVKGGNYGWPVHEGMCQENCEGYINPVHTYHHDGGSAAVTGGPVYRADMFPAEYKGTYFFGDYARGFIKYLTFDDAGNVTGVHDFDTNAGSVVDMKIAPDGSMYYITYYPGRMYQVTYNTDNPAPTANATADQTKGASVPFTVNFSSEGSSDPEGQPLTYLWDFGDGTTSTEANPSHTYTERGSYTVELQVSDGEHTANAVPVVIQAGEPPQVTIGAPADGSTYVAGQEITYNAHAIDSAGFDMNDGDIVTDVIFHHQTHTHPFLDNFVGRSHTFTIPDTGEASAETWYEIRTTATDEAGVSDTESINIYPETTQMTYATQPEGLEIRLDGVPHTGPHTIEQVVNFRRELSAPATQIGPGGEVYSFKGWSDGGAIRHFAAAPAGGATITAVYEPSGAFKGEYFDNQNLEGTPVLVRDDKQINFNWGLGAPDPAVPEDFFSVRWTKQQYFAEGRYKFTTGSDDGVRLYIDGRLVIDEWHDQGFTPYSYVTNLSEGMHDIKLEYYDKNFDAAALFSWEATRDQTTPTPSGWRATFFNNQTLEGDPVLLRGDQEINFDWGLGAPDPAVNADQFSARWSKTEYFETSTYRFSATSDDGIRVYLDGELIIDEWNDHSKTTFTAERIITAGNHDLKVEYYENGYTAIAQLAIEKIEGDPTPPPVEDGFTAEYFDNQTLTGEPVLTRQEAAINHDWGLEAPAEGVPADQFSARWTKTEEFAGGIYTFSATADDGVRVFINGQPIIDKWVDQSAPTHTAEVELPAGEHTITMEYYENGWAAVAKLAYEKTGDAPEPPADTPWQINFYDGRNLEGAPLAQTENATLDFDWGLGAPLAGVPADNFSATFTKTDTFEEGIYQFNITADDGVRIYVDGQKVYDQWVDQSAALKSVNIAMTAGQHEIKMEYYEHGWDAIAKLSYAPTTGTADPLEQPFTAEFFGNKTLSGAPIHTRQDANIGFDWGLGAPFAGGPEDNFSVRWSKTQEFKAGTYHVAATSDDGIRIYVDGNLVIDQWHDHSITSYETNITLAAGAHSIVVEYYEHTYDAIAKVEFTQL